MRIKMLVGGLFAAAAFSAHAAQYTVELHDDFYDPAQLTIAPGDSVRWVNMGNNAHNVHADDDSFRCAVDCGSGSGGGDPYGGVMGPGDPSSQSWEVTKTFDEAGDVRFHCDNHGQPGGIGMAGTIHVKAADSPSGNIPINFGLTGSWFNADENGQGFLFEVVPLQSGQQGDATGVLYWFTFAKGQPGGVNRQRWYQAQGAIQGDVAMLDTVLQVTGGVFDDPVDPSSVTDVGTVMLTFSSCTEGKVAYDLDLDGDGQNETTGEIPIQRLTPDVLCESMLNGM